MEDKFNNIYKKNIWGGGSGTGSKLSHDNKWYLSFIKDIIKDKEIKTILDIGCGDWEIMKNFSYDGLKYDGIDIVKSVIDANESYVKPNIHFYHKNILNEDINNYDLIIIKDVLQHLEDNDIIKIMDKLMKKGSYILCVNGFKFGRTPEKNEWESRNIKNRYSYHPVSIDKMPLIKYKGHMIKKEIRRCKEYILIKT
jgi:2-polyprenyl-3-methyl-5-hydroxy-6-metoxy-1,4-benzoquinol methylase